MDVLKEKGLPPRQNSVSNLDFRIWGFYIRMQKYQNLKSKFGVNNLTTPINGSRAPFYYPIVNELSRGTIFFLSFIFNYFHCTHGRSQGKFAGKTVIIRKKMVSLLHKHLQNIINNSCNLIYYSVLTKGKVTFCVIPKWRSS